MSQCQTVKEMENATNTASVNAMILKQMRIMRCVPVDVAVIT